MGLGTRSIPTQCSAHSRITAAQPLPMNSCPVAPPSTRATPTSHLRLLTTNAAILLFAYSAVALTSARLRCSRFQGPLRRQGRARHPDSYTYSDAETFTDGETGVNAYAASYAATAPVALTFVAVSAVRHDSRSGPRLCEEAQHH